MTSSFNQQLKNESESINDNATPRALAASQGFQVVPSSDIISSVINKEFVLILTNKLNILRYDPSNAQQNETQRCRLAQRADMNSGDENMDMDFVEELHRLIHAYLNRTYRVFPLDYIIDWSSANTNH